MKFSLIFFFPSLSCCGAFFFFFPQESFFFFKICFTSKNSYIFSTLEFVSLI